MELTVLSLGRGAGRKVGMLREGQIVVGPQFSEPMAVETVRADGVDTWVVGLVGVSIDGREVQRVRFRTRSRG
jgi:hypothetical protein